MATDSPDLPSFFAYDKSNTTVRSPSVMLTNDENFIRKPRRKRTTPDERTKKHKNCLQRLILSLPIFHPFGIFKRCWDLLITIMLLYTAVEIPFTFVADLRVWTYVNVYSVTALVIDAFLFLDILVSFRTARFFKYDHLKLEVNAFKIAKRYILGTFFIDIATSFPYQLIMNYNAFIVPFTILRSLKLIRLYLMMRQSTSNRSITSTHKEFRAFVRIFKLACAVLLIIHYTACVWWFEGKESNPSWMDAENARGLPAFEKYSYSLYFVATIKFVKATNVLEQWITIIHTLIGTATLSYFIGTLSSMISKGDRLKTVKEIRMSEAQAFCDQYNLPTRMTRAILAHLKYHFSNNYIFDKNKIFANIPTYLYKMVAKQLAQRVVEKITFFKPLRSDVRGLIALKTKSISCNAGYKLYKKGDKYNKIYIQRTGHSLLSFHDGSGQKMIKRRGDVFGEDALCSYLSPDFNGQNRSISTLQCKTWSEFYVIQITDVIDILKSEFGKKWKHKLKEITKIIVVSHNIFNNRYTPRYKVTDIDLAHTNKAKTQKSFKSLFQFNEFESIIHPQSIGNDMQISAQTSIDDIISPLALNNLNTIQIEAQQSKTRVIQLANIKQNNSYQSISMIDDNDNDNDNKDDSTDDDIDIVIEENEIKDTKDIIIDIKNDNFNELDNDDNNTDETDEFDGQANNLYAISKHFSKQRNGKKRIYVSDNQLKSGVNSKQIINGQEYEDQIDRATTLSVINTMPIKKSDSHWKPRSNSFSINDDYMETSSRMKHERNRTHSFNLRTSYFKKTKSELRDRHLSIEYDATSLVKLKIPNIPENNTIYKIDEDMD